MEVSDISDEWVSLVVSYPLGSIAYSHRHREDRMDVLDLEGIDDDLELETELQVETMETGRSYRCRD